MKLTDYTIVDALFDGKTVVREKGEQYDIVWLHGKGVEFCRHEGNYSALGCIPDYEMLFSDGWRVKE